MLKTELLTFFAMYMILRHESVAKVLKHNELLTFIFKGGTMETELGVLKI